MPQTETAPGQGPTRRLRLQSLQRPRVPGREASGAASASTPRYRVGGVAAGRRRLLLQPSTGTSEAHFITLIGTRRRVVGGDSTAMHWNQRSKKRNSIPNLVAFTTPIGTAGGRGVEQGRAAGRGGEGKGGSPVEEDAAEEGVDVEVPQGSRHGGGRWGLARRQALQAFQPARGEVRWKAGGRARPCTSASRCMRKFR
jgi:hypothetical protein